ncbi:MAG: hypothetical protein EON54_22340 [Alcaligenaceae bacterium]|nr:MAG: hypothetical protein EON54_22340 [Alcaligenaceae bacterium]
MTPTPPPVQALIPRGWEVSFWLSAGKGPHRATIERAGAVMCSLTVSDHDHDRDGAKSALELRAASWIAEFQSRQRGF